MLEFKIEDFMFWEVLEKPLKFGYLKKEIPTMKHHTFIEEITRKKLETLDKFVFSHGTWRFDNGDFLLDRTLEGLDFFWGL